MGYRPKCVFGGDVLRLPLFCFRGGETAVGPQGCGTRAGMGPGTGAGNGRRPAGVWYPCVHGAGNGGAGDWMPARPVGKGVRAWGRARGGGQPAR